MRADTKKISIVPKVAEVFKGKARFRGAYGGRGSGKTKGFASMLMLRSIIFSHAGISGRMLCSREYQNSINDSVLGELREVLDTYPWMRGHFDIGEKYLRTKDRRIEFVFSGLTDKQLNSLKGKAKILVAWLEEAETISEKAYQTLIPTLRSEGVMPNGTPWQSEVWCTWNPCDEGSPTDKRFRQSPSRSTKCVKVNYSDNPFFPSVSEEDRLSDMERLDLGTYEWIWEGEYLQNSDTQVMAGKIKIMEFEARETHWDGPYYGLDFGFSSDPNAAVRCWINDKCLWIDYNWEGRRVEVEDLPGALDKNIPGIKSSTVRADSARPDTISYLIRHGLPRCISVKKHAIEDGISFLRSFRWIVVHPRCKPIISESKAYRYKVNAAGDITTTIIDAHNHSFDALRYAVSPHVKSGKIAINAKYRK